MRVRSHPRLIAFIIAILAIILTLPLSLQQGRAQSSPAEPSNGRPAPTAQSSPTSNINTPTSQPSPIIPASKAAGQGSILVGVNFIDTSHWQDYQLPAARLMKISIAKVNLYYDCSDCPNGVSSPYFSTPDLDDILGLGVGTVIIRTADTANSPVQVEQQLNQPLNGRQSILAYIQAHPEVTFWVEVGNETDQGGQSANVAEANLLAVANQVIAPLRSVTNLRWMLPAPSQLHPDYAVQLLQDGKLMNAYDAVGVHTYGANTLDRGDYAQPYLVLDAAKPYLKGKPVFITEAGINSDMDWSDKAKLYLQAIRAQPSYVAGWVVFTFSQDAYWCQRTRYAIDVVPVDDSAGHTACQLDPAFPAARLIGQR